MFFHIQEDHKVKFRYVVQFLIVQTVQDALEEHRLILKHRLNRLNNNFTVDWTKVEFAISQEDKIADYRNEYAEKNCLICGRLYTPKRYDARTCGGECSVEWIRQSSLYKWKSGQCKYCHNPGLPEYKSACAEHVEYDKKKARAAKAKLYQERKLSGICVKCAENPVSPNSTILCGKCRSYNNMLRRIRRKRNHQQKVRV